MTKRFVQFQFERTSIEIRGVSPIAPSTTV